MKSWSLVLASCHWSLARCEKQNSLSAFQLMKIQFKSVLFHIILVLSSQNMVIAAGTCQCFSTVVLAAAKKIWWFNCCDIMRRIFLGKGFPGFFFSNVQGQLSQPGVNVHHENISTAEAKFSNWWLNLNSAVLPVNSPNPAPQNVSDQFRICPFA